VSDAFQEALQVEQDLLNGIDTDKICPFIEDFICKQEPITKVIYFVMVIKTLEFVHTHSKGFIEKLKTRIAHR